MFYLLVEVSFAYLLPVSLSRCAFPLYLQKDNFFQCYSVLSDFIKWPIMIMSRDWVSSVSYCSIYQKSLPLDKLLKFVVTSLT